MSCLAQGFGKRKNMVGMARAKKQKVDKVEALLSKAPVTEMDTMAAGGGMPSTTEELQEPAAAALKMSAEMSGEEAQVAIFDFLEESRVAMREWEKRAR